MLLLLELSRHPTSPKSQNAKIPNLSECRAMSIYSYRLCGYLVVTNEAYCDNASIILKVLFFFFDELMIFYSSIHQKSTTVRMKVFLFICDLCIVALRLYCYYSRYCSSYGFVGSLWCIVYSWCVGRFSRYNDSIA
jgi:hypothetical protein